MALQRVLVTIEIVVAQEMTEEGAVILLPQGNDPRRQCGGEQQPAERIERGLQPIREVLLRDEEQQASGERQRDGDRPLRQKAQAHPQINAQHAAERRRLTVAVDAEHGCGEQHVEQCIRDGGMADQAGHDAEAEADAGE